MKYLLDINILSELMRGAPNPHVVAWLDQQNPAHLYISAITVAEILYGIARLPEGQRKQKLAIAAVAMFQEDFKNRICGFDQFSAEFYADLVNQRVCRGLAISQSDAQIASIALCQQMTVVTRNIKDFSQIDGLTVLNPF
jgi:predicted nucleic acid-binding protein